MHPVKTFLATITLCGWVGAVPYALNVDCDWDWGNVARGAMPSPIGNPTEAYEKWAGIAREAAPPTKKREAEAWQTEARRHLPDKRAPATAKREAEASATTSSTIPSDWKRGARDKRTPKWRNWGREAVPSPVEKPTEVDENWAGMAREAAPTSAKREAEALPTEAKRAVPDKRAPDLMARDPGWSSRAIERDAEAAMQKRQCHFTLDGEQDCPIELKRSIEEDDNELEKRVPVNMTRRSDGEVCIYLTDEYNWNGNASNVSSAGPSESQDCSLYSEPSCRGEHVAGLQYPGSPDLRGVGFDKTARSWICYDKPQLESTPLVKSRAYSPPAPGRRGEDKRGWDKRAEDKRDPGANLDMSNLQNGLAQLLGRPYASYQAYARSPDDRQDAAERPGLEARQDRRFGGSGWKREAYYSPFAPIDLSARGWWKKREPLAGYHPTEPPNDWPVVRRSDEELNTSGEGEGDEMQDIVSRGGPNHEKRLCRTWRGFPVCV
ncbi:hypothetical protein HII31_11768 [Pseudocercospora fuligena]|uniref:Uncharacterized protein n=1 Tax=Pseudocercospora fuligena TaxID=685502 RepID=A0A8H6VC37_9PEZI|nr:hypothetical protein HII31_11768 [Pseudocercospora fuligena]